MSEPVEIPQSDEDLLDKLLDLLKATISTDGYSTDGSHAAELRTLPVGLRAMAATHPLDVSLTMDDIAWHFGNFGEPNLVAETQAGLRELGLVELADLFAQTYAIVGPHLSNPEIAGDWHGYMSEHGLEESLEELARKSWKFNDESEQVIGSAIYGAWIRYTRAHPEKVFGARSFPGNSTG